MLTTSNVIGGKNILIYISLFILGAMLMLVGCYLVYLSSRELPPRMILTTGGGGHQGQNHEMAPYKVNDSHSRDNLMRSLLGSEEEEEKKESYDTVRSNFDL